MTRRRIIFIIGVTIIIGFIISMFIPDSSAPASQTTLPTQPAAGSDATITSTTNSDDDKPIQSSSTITKTASLTETLEFRRDDIQTVYEELWDFQFQPGVEVKGRPRIVGKAANGLALIELIGTEEERPRASIAVSFPRNAPRAVAENSIYMAQLLTLAAPSWKEGGDWLSNGISRVFQQEKVETTHDDLNFRLQFHEGLGMVVFTIQSLESLETETTEDITLPIEDEADSAVEETTPTEEETDSAEGETETTEDGIQPADDSADSAIEKRQEESSGQ